MERLSDNPLAFRQIDWSFLTGSVSVGLGYVLARGLGFAFMTMLAWLYTPADYGFIRYSIALGTIAAVLVAPCGQVLSQFLARDPDDRQASHVYFSNYVFGAIGLLLPSLAFATVFTYLQGEVNVGVLAVVVGETIFFSYFGVARGLLSSGKMAIFYPASNAVQILMVLLAVYVLGLSSPTLILTIYGLCYLVPVFAIEAVSPSPVSFDVGLISRRTLYELGKFAVPIVSAHALYTLWFWLDTLIVEHYFGEAAVGSYAVAKTLVSVFVFAPNAIGTILMPKVAELQDRRSKWYLYISIVLVVVPSVVLFVVFGFLRTTLIRLLFGESYLRGSEALLALAAGMSLYAVYQVLSAWWVGLGKPVFHTRSIGVAMLTTAVADLYLVPTRGLFGAGLGFTLGALTGLIALMWITVRHIRRVGLSAAGIDGAAGSAVT